jgi:predicted secreted protein
MPQNEINGRDILVFIDPAGGTSWKTVVCLTSNTMNNSLTELDASSKCGNAWVPGAKFEATITGEGFLVDQDTGTATDKGFPELYDLFDSRAEVAIKFGKATATTGDAIWTGTAFITKLDLVANDDALTTFSVTFRCANPPFTQTLTY